MENKKIITEDVDDVLLGTDPALCPYCKSHNITYGGSAVQDNSMYYEVSCQDCEKDWKEWYTLENPEIWGKKK